MAKVVNIRRDVDDKFYRYKMPVLQTKIEGKGNGIKTVIPNMSDVARALARPPSYTTKFFGCELGAQTTFDDKTDRYIVNGAHQADRLRELLDGFIDKFVLCGSCKNPETDLILTKTDDIIRDCKACGQRSAVDMRHKLTTFIVKNPPPKKKKGTKGAHAEAANRATQEVEELEGDDELTKRIHADAAHVPTADQANVDDEWSVDTSEAAVAARVAKLAEGVERVLGGGSDDEGGAAPEDELGLWIEERRAAEESFSGVEVYNKAKELGIESKHKTVQVVMQSVFTEDALKELDGYIPMLQKMVADSEKHQKSLLGGLERLVGVNHPALLPQTPKLLMKLYQADLLDEDLIQHWGTHVSKKYVDKDVSKKVRRASEPFLKWLEEADDDESD